MRFELWMFFLTSMAIAYVYLDISVPRILTLLHQYKKAVHIALVVIVACFIYWAIKSSYYRMGELVHLTHEYLRFLPTDKSDTRTSRPFDFSSSQAFAKNPFFTAYSPFPSPLPATLAPSSSDDPYIRRAQTRMMNSGKQNQSKRSVSETKKKFVAASQGWTCGQCTQPLSAWFEVDHKLRLEYGGTNEVDNLVALCRECHAMKTAMETM